MTMMMIIIIVAIIIPLPQAPLQSIIRAAVVAVLTVESPRAAAAVVAVVPVVTVDAAAISECLNSAALYLISMKIVNVTTGRR